MNNSSKIGFGLWFSVVIIILTALAIWFVVSQKSEKENYQNLSSREAALLCTTDMATQFHIHSELTILINGEKQTIPAEIGITDGCMNSVHTHDTTGTIHIESPVKKDFTIGDFFAVWKKEFNQDQILDYKSDATHAVTITVNGVSVDTYENTIMKDDEKIVVSYGVK